MHFTLNSRGNTVFWNIALCHKDIITQIDLYTSGTTPDTEGLPCLGKKQLLP